MAKRRCGEYQFSTVRPSGEDAANRAWTLQLLAESEPGRRNRRSIDGVLVAAAAAIVGLTAVIARSASAEDDAVGQALVTVFGWAEAVWRVTLVAALVLAVGVVGDAVFRRRRDLARDLAIALLLLAGGSGTRFGLRFGGRSGMRRVALAGHEAQRPKAGRRTGR